MSDIFAELEKKPSGAGPYKKFKGDFGVRWSSLTEIWHGEPWSFASWRLANIKNPKKKIKAKAIEGRAQGCLHAGIAETTLPMGAMLAVGFGSVEVVAGGRCIWSGDDTGLTVSRVERLAATKNRIDWEIVYNGPLYGKRYKRAGVGRWVLVGQNEGFA